MKQTMIEALTQLPPGVAYAVVGVKRSEVLSALNQVPRNDVRFSVTNSVITQADGMNAKGVCVMVETINESAQRRNEVIDQLAPGASAEFKVEDDLEYNSIKNAVKYRRRAGQKLSTRKAGDKVTVLRHG